MSLSLRTRIGLAGLAVLAAACGSSTTAVNQELLNAKAAWKANAPPSYDLTIEPICFCGFEASGPVVVAVRNGVVQSRTYVQTGAPVSARSASLYPTVDELFAILEAALSKMPERMDVIYDPVLGYPVSVAIDYKLGVADDEMFYHVTSFAVR
jgi:hypothetical protein